MNSLASLAEKARAKLLYRALPSLVDRLVALSTVWAKRKLAPHGPIKLLVDNNVLGHSVTHETAWVDTGKQRWGDAEIDSGHLARIPVHSDTADSAEARSIRYLPGIASLARSGHISLHCSAELADERWTQPAGRFRGYGMYDYSLLRGVEVNRLPDPEYTMTMGTSWSGYPSVEEQRKRRLAAKTDPLFLGLLDALGPKNSQDAHHIYTAQLHGCFCFMTMDFRLIRAVRSQQGHKAIRALSTLVLSPEDFGEQFGLWPTAPRWFSYHNASFPVLGDEKWPDSKRRRPRRSDA